MHPFRYVAAHTIDEAVSLLSEHGPRGRVFAGGTDVLVQLRAGRFDLDVLVDLKGIPEASSLGLNEGLSIGAAVPCYQIYENQEVTTRFPGIIDAASLIGGIQIQSRASIGGNLCNASPSADGICPLIVHSGAAQIVGPLEGRAVPVEEFCTGPGNNILADNEFLVAINVPEPPANFGAAYERFIPRNEMDIAIAGVASAITLDASGTRIVSGRIALAAVGPTPILAKQASDSLAGRTATEEDFAEISEIASTEASPIEDMRGTPAQRVELIKVLTRRTLAIALQRARKNG